MAKVIAYLRFSPRRNAEMAESNETQLEYIIEWCAKNGHVIAGSFSDEETSGDDEDRPGLWAAVAALKKDFLLVVYKYDRLARSVYLDEFIRREARSRKARIAAVVGDRSSDEPQDVLIRQVMAAFAEYEKKIIAARTKSAMLRHQKTGRAMGNVPPFGFMRGPDEILADESGKVIARRRWVPCHEEKMAIRRALQWLEQGANPCHTAKQMNSDKDYPTLRGKPWTRLSVTRIRNRYRSEKSIQSTPAIPPVESPTETMAEPAIC